MKLIDSDAGLAAAARQLSDAKVFYVDTEFESNRQGKTLSVIQVSAGGDVHLVDALRLRRLDPLAAAMTRPRVTWVLHAGLQDVELLAERFRVTDPPALFDTQIAWGLQGPEHSVSLAYLQFKLLGLRSMKTHQADDWIRRPLPSAQLEYAAKDIEHLPKLHELLLERLEGLDRRDITDEVCREQLVVEPESREPLGLGSFRNAWQLDRRAQAALRHLIDWYNGLSTSEQTEALPPKAFLSVASRLPATANDLARIKGVPNRWARRHGEEIVPALSAAVRDASSDTFVPIEPPPYSTFEDIRLDAWLVWMRAEVCTRLQIAPEIAFGTRVVKRIRRAIVEESRLEAGARALVGWRERVLAPAYRDFASGSSFPLPAG